MRLFVQPLQPTPSCLNVLQKGSERENSEGALKISQTQCNREMERRERRERQREKGVAVSADKSAYGN